MEAYGFRLRSSTHFQPDRLWSLLKYRTWHSSSPDKTTQLLHKHEQTRTGLVRVWPLWTSTFLLKITTTAHYDKRMRFVAPWSSDLDSRLNSNEAKKTDLCYRYSTGAFRSSVSISIYMLGVLDAIFLTPLLLDVCNFYKGSPRDKPYHCLKFRWLQFSATEKHYRGPLRSWNYAAYSACGQYCSQCLSDLHSRVQSKV